MARQAKLEKISQRGLIPLQTLFLIAAVFAAQGWFFGGGAGGGWQEWAGNLLGRQNKCVRNFGCPPYSTCGSRGAYPNTRCTKGDCCPTKWPVCAGRGSGAGTTHCFECTEANVENCPRLEPGVCDAGNKNSQGKGCVCVRAECSECKKFGETDRVYCGQLEGGLAGVNPRPYCGTNTARSPEFDRDTGTGQRVINSTNSGSPYICKECLQDGHCAARVRLDLNGDRETPQGFFDERKDRCILPAGRCVECRSDDECRSDYENPPGSGNFTKPFCDLGTGLCVSACANGRDDDGDGKIDFPADPGCQNLQDQQEQDEVLPTPVVTPLSDRDRDMLFDSEELTYGTNPDDPDTDDDGLTDFAEVRVYLTDPLKADTDCGGVNDGDEVQHGSIPRSGFGWDDPVWLMQPFFSAWPPNPPGVDQTGGNAAVGC